MSTGPVGGRVLPTRAALMIVVLLLSTACGQRADVHPLAAPASASAPASEEAPSRAPVEHPTATAAPEPEAAPPTVAAPAPSPVAIAVEDNDVSGAKQPANQRQDAGQPVQPVGEDRSPAVLPTPTDAASEVDRGAPLWGRRYRSYRVTRAGEERQLVEGTAIQIRFVRAQPHRKADEDGVAWHTGCNWTAGPLNVRPRQLLIDGEMSTAAGCYPEYQRQEDWVDRFMESDPQWALDGRELTLIHGRTTISMREVPDRS